MYVAKGFTRDSSRFSAYDTPLEDMLKLTGQARYGSAAASVKIYGGSISNASKNEEEEQMLAYSRKRQEILAPEPKARLGYALKALDSGMFDLYKSSKN